MPDVTRIIEQTATESIYNDDWILTDRPTEGEDGGTRKILASKLKELFCGDYIADEWESLVTYNYGRFVTHEGKLYYNNSGGALVQITFNSNAWLEVRIDELLEKLIGSIGEKWRRVDTYHYDDLVVYGGRLYRCIKNASTQGTWVSNEWIEANAEYYFKKVREYIARYDFVPSGEAVSSPYNKGDLILYRAPGDTTNSLYMRLNDTEHGDPTWIPENWLKVENIGGALSKIYDDMEESSCDVQIKEQSIVDENNVADLTSLAAVGSASGAIATFDDGSALPMPSLKVAIEPQQDLHGYDAPWVGGAGKNKWEFDSSLSGNGNVLGGKVFTNKIPLGTYTLSCKGTFASGGAMAFRFVYTDDTTKDVTLGYNVQSGTYYVSAVFEKAVRALSYVYSNNADNSINSIQLEQGATATSYAPYSNICPISGWTACNVVRTGKNLWDRDNLRRGVYTNADGTTQSGSATTNFSSQFIKIMPNTTYSITMFGESYENGSLFGVYYDEYKNGLNQFTNILRLVSNESKTFTTPSNAHYVVFSGYRGAGTDIFTTANTMVCEGTPTTYEPYNGQTYTIDLNGTRYGGTLNVVSGVLTVDKGYVDLGSLTWQEFTQLENTMFNASLTGIVGASADTISSQYRNGYRYGWGNLPNGYFRTYDNGVRIKDDNYSDATTFKTAMNGVQLVYELATPLTIQLTPTQVKSLLGVNNIWADTGDILDAEYIRDMTTIINSLIARIEALENQ